MEEEEEEDEEEEEEEEEVVVKYVMNVCVCVLSDNVCIQFVCVFVVQVCELV